jgi:hypothetical protein
VADKDDTTDRAAAGPSADFDVTNAGPDEGWQLAIGLIRAWRGAGERTDGAVAQRLAEVAAEGRAATVEQAVTGLVALGNMFLELYADRAGLSIERILWDAAAVPTTTASRSRCGSSPATCRGGPRAAFARRHYPVCGCARAAVPARLGAGVFSARAGGSA